MNTKLSASQLADIKAAKLVKYNISVVKPIGTSKEFVNPQSNESQTCKYAQLEYIASNAGMNLKARIPHKQTVTSIGSKLDRVIFDVIEAAINDKAYIESSMTKDDKGNESSIKTLKEQFECKFVTIEVDQFYLTDSKGVVLLNNNGTKAIDNKIILQIFEGDIDDDIQLTFNDELKRRRVLANLVSQDNSSTPNPAIPAEDLAEGTI
jgi:hypothetical protein